MPYSTAETEFISQSDGTYDVKIDWNRPNTGQWSIAISKVAGADPGPLTDTVISEYTFKDVSPGTYYINA